MFLSKHSNGIYYLWFTNESGKKQKVSTHCTLKSEAYQFLQSFKSDEHERRKKIKRKFLTEFITDYLLYAEANFTKGSVGICKETFKKFLSFTEDIPLTSFTPKHFDAYKTERLKSVKAVTVNIELRTLRAFFNTAVRWNLLERTPFNIQLARVPETQPVFLTKLDFQKLLNVMKEKWLKEVVIFAVSTGLRRGELVNLRWNNIDLQRKLVTVESNSTFRTKSGRRRVIPLNDAALYILKAKQVKEVSEYVFTLNDQQLRADWVAHLFKRYVRKANLSNLDIHFHSLRHTFASWLVQDGTSIYIIKDFLGHSDVKTTAVYSHLQPTQLHSEVNKISIILN